MGLGVLSAMISYLYTTSSTGKWRFMKSKKHLMKPKMAIISLLEGNFALSTSENVTSTETEDFLDHFDKGLLNLQKFDIQVRK